MNRRTRPLADALYQPRKESLPHYLPFPPHTVGCLGSGILNRVAILLVGVVVGYVTFISNIMMSDSSTAFAMRVASMGMGASGLFIIGGVIGLFWGSWRALLPGLILQCTVWMICIISSLFMHL
jgi:hypothetical protein